MPPISPQQAAQIAYILSAFAAGAIIQQDPATLPGITALGNAMVGIGTGKSTPADAATALQLFLSELNVKAPGSQIPGFSILVGAVLAQVQAAKNPLAPDLVMSALGSILTTIGGGFLFAASQAPAPATITGSALAAAAPLKAA